jgi:hypothetical protein
VLIGYSSFSESSTVEESKPAPSALEDEGITVLQNTNRHSPSDTVSHPKTPESSKEDTLQRLM